MKLALALLVTTALGFSSYRAATTSDPLPPPAVAGEECKVSVKCTPEGTCLIRCESPDGKVCIKEIVCEEGQCAVKSCQGTPCAPGACK